MSLTANITTTRVSELPFVAAAPAPAPRLPALASTPPGALAGELHGELTRLIRYRGAAATSVGWSEQYISHRVDRWLQGGGAAVAAMAMGAWAVTDPGCTWPLLGLLAGGAAGLGFVAARVGVALYHEVEALICGLRALEAEQTSFLDEVSERGTPLDKAVAAAVATLVLERCVRRRVRGDEARTLLERTACLPLPADVAESGRRIVASVTAFFDPVTGEPRAIIGSTRAEAILDLLNALTDLELRTVATYLDPIVFSDASRTRWDLPSQAAQVAAKMSIARPSRDG